MGDAPLILGVSGLRGIVGESLTPEVAVRYAAAFAQWLQDPEAPSALTPTVVVGRDGRAGGDVIADMVVSSLRWHGCHVVDLGVAMTPTVGFAVDQITKAIGGIVITASHNPQEWNGIKCLSGRNTLLEEVRTEDTAGAAASAPNADQAADVIHRFQKGPGPSSTPWTMGKLTVDNRLMDLHAAAARAGFFDAIEQTDTDEQRPAFQVVIDSVNCCGAAAAEALLDGYAAITQLHGDGSGMFPHTPEPTAENLSGNGGLCDAVPGLKADVGFAQDPDGDRLAIVDERGVYIGEEYTLAIAAEAILGAMASDRGPQAQSTEGAVLVANLSTSRMIEDVAAAYGARVERTAVGEANVVERMKALKAAGERCVLGGEGNGGVIWPEVTYVRDSLGAMALTLGLMAREGTTVSQLVSKINGYARGGGYTIVKRKQGLASKADAEPALQRVAERYAGERVDTQDGVRVDFDAGARAGSWVHVRASNTEPILRLIGEAATEAAAGELLDEVAAIVNG